VSYFYEVFGLIDKKSLEPLNAETTLGKVFTSLMSRLAILGLFDYFVGYERFENRILTYFSGEVKKEEMDKLVELFDQSTMHGEDEVPVHVKYRQSSFQDGPAWIVELYAGELMPNGGEDFVPTEVDLKGDVEPEQVSKGKEKDQDKEKEMEVAKETVTCWGCGKQLVIDDLDFDLVTDEDGITEDAKMICPVCQSEFAISALLTKPGGEEAAGPGAYEPEEEFEPPEEEEEEEPGVEGAAAPGEEGQIRPESFPEKAANILERMDKGELSVEEAFGILTVRKSIDEGGGSKKEFWKGSLVDFQAKLFGVADDLNVSLDDVEDMIKDLSEGDAVVLKQNSIEVDVEKTIDIVIGFIEDKNRKAYMPDPTLPQPSSIDDDDFVEPAPEPELDVGMEPEFPDDFGSDLAFGNVQPLGQVEAFTEGEAADDEREQKDDLKSEVEKAVRKYFC